MSQQESKTAREDTSFREVVTVDGRNTTLVRDGSPLDSITVCEAPGDAPGEIVYPQPALAARQPELAAEAFPAVNTIVDEQGYPQTRLEARSRKLEAR